jgi:hypothetical protein
LVCFTTVGCGAGALYTGADEYVPDERDEVLRRGADVVLRTVVRGAVAVLVSALAGTVVVAVPARSAAVMLSSGVYGPA